jgi:hypothetical protein
LGIDRLRLGDSAFGASSWAGAAASTLLEGLRFKEMSFFKKSVIPLTG